MAENDVPDSTDWLSTPLNGLAAVEAALRCQVCKDFYRTPMLTSCCHTFCSLCIRRALSNDGKCPLCRAGEQELKLRSNWSMEETVEAFVKARPDVLAAARKPQSSRTTSPKRKADEAETLDGGDHAPSNKRLRTSARLSRNRAEARPPEPVAEDEEDEVVEVPDDNDDDSYTPENTNEGQGMVACPVCNVKMKEWQVFKHLETCNGPPEPATNGQSSSSFASLQRKPSGPPLERLPAINYSMLKDNALRKKLSELGISPSGPRPLLEKRHKEWITIWNANCDAARPKKRSQLMHDLDVWERTQGGRAPTTGRTVQNAAMIKDKDFDGKAWATTHDDSFRELIANARKNRTKVAEAKSEEQPQAETLSPNGESRQSVQDHQMTIPSSQEEDVPMVSEIATRPAPEDSSRPGEKKQDDLAPASILPEGELPLLDSRKDSNWDAAEDAHVL
ncbi:zinc finger, c3HC4 type (RING finger) domain-containing protein [Sarocladium implicatum]|nr:zinc finger, c3HC4 type (RING finger) domain-containing protein [Sarocladium implicatum]